MESLGAGLQEDHSCVDATALSPGVLHIILGPENEAAIDLRPMGPVAVAPNHRRRCLQLEEIIQTLQGDRVQVEKETVALIAITKADSGRSQTARGNRA